jgi:hypothetical protein
MKYFNKFSVLLLVLFVSFQSCVEEEPLLPEVETFKSIDDLPTDDRFVEVIIGTINLTSQANPDLMDRARELTNQENLSVLDQAEVAQIMGYESWDAFNVYNQKQQNLIKALNIDYNLVAYEVEELTAYTDEVYEYIIETQATSRNDLTIGSLTVGGVIGGIVDPCTENCIDILANCLIDNGIVFTENTLGCIISDPPPLFCNTVNVIVTTIYGFSCIFGYGICIANC